ncbi:MAG: cobaltochelatase subunit CobN [Pseudomonadota bacterium]
MSRPVAAITFYRALIQGAQTAPIEALVEALDRNGVNALPVFSAALDTVPPKPVNLAGGTC